MDSVIRDPAGIVKRLERRHATRDEGVSPLIPG